MTDVPPQERLHALDAVRGFALLLGIVLHGCMSFMPKLADAGWPIVDVSQSGYLGHVFYVIHVFRMATFFIIAGFFARLVFHRRGARHFIRDRTNRILIPLVVWWLPVALALLMTLALAHARNPASVSAQYNEMVNHYTQSDVPLMHLWFLYILLWLYGLTLPLRTLIAKLDQKGRIRDFVDRQLARMVKSYLAPFVLALPIAITLNAIPRWLWLGGIPTPDTSIVPLWYSLLIYLYLFCLGWVLQRQQDLLATIRRQWTVNLMIGIAAVLTCLFIAGWDSGLLSEAPPDRKLAYASSYAVATLALSIAVIGCGIAYFKEERPVIRYLADASYWMYVWHLPIVFALQTLLMNVNMSWVIKFPLILALTCVPLLATYNWLVRSTVIGETMNGRRYPRGLPRRRSMAGEA